MVCLSTFDRFHKFYKSYLILDLLVQAKSGTGKTLVFSILIANTIMETRSKECVAVVLAPVREIALQIKDTVEKVVPPKTRIWFVCYL